MFFFTAWRTNHIFCHLSSQCILMGSCQKMLITNKWKGIQQFLADWNTGSIFLVKNLSIQPQLAENDELWSCIRSFAFFWNLKTDIGKCKSLNAKIHVSISSSSSAGNITGRYVPGKLHLLESFILSGTGQALIIPRTVDSFISNTFAFSAKFPLIDNVSVLLFYFGWNCWRGWLAVKFKLFIIFCVEINLHIKVMAFCYCI